MLATLPLLLALANAPTAAAPVQDPAQQVARRAVQQGRYVPLESVVRDALKRYRASCWKWSWTTASTKWRSCAATAWWWSWTMMRAAESC